MSSQKSRTRAHVHKARHVLTAAIIASEASHIFCCVLPTVFSLLSLMVGLGMVTAMPGGMVFLHEALHAWEIPMISASGGIIVLGWALHYYSMKIDCHDTGCGHGPCGPKKKTATTILKIATVLFAVNLLIYLVFHQGADIFMPETAEIHAH